MSLARSRYNRYLDPDDRAQEAALARLLAARSGADPEAAARRAVARADKAEQRYRIRFATNRGDGAESPLGWLAEADRLVGRPRSPREARRDRGLRRPQAPWRAAAAEALRARRAREDALRAEADARRDGYVVLAARAGLDHRRIAELFDLDGPARVALILADRG